MRVQVKDFMITPVVSTTIKSNVGYVRELMERKEVNAIPVVEVNGEINIRGMVTSTDLRGISDESISVEEVMSKKVHVVSRNSSAQSAANMMVRHSVHHLLVMNKGEIIGMISSFDFVKLVAKHNLGL